MLSSARFCFASLKIPAKLQPCRRRDETTAGTYPSESHLRDLETKINSRLCNHLKPKLISRPRRRQLKSSQKVRTVSAQSPKTAAASQDAEPKTGRIQRTVGSWSGRFIRGSRRILLWPVRQDIKWILKGVSLLFPIYSINQ